MGAYPTITMSSLGASPFQIIIAYGITAYRVNVTAYSSGSVTPGVSWW
jgi:hypothetical protein